MKTTEIIVLRDVNRFRNVATPGTMFFAGTEDCVTLEDPVRERWNSGEQKWEWRADYKIPGKTAIPSGRYSIIVDMSTRFKRLMPHILNVPDFDGIRVHNGGTTEHTDGCPLVGRQLNVTNEIPFLTGSKADAFPKFYDKLIAALSMGRVFITFDNGVPK